MRTHVCEKGARKARENGARTARERARKKASATRERRVGEGRAQRDDAASDFDAGNGGGKRRLRRVERCARRLSEKRRNAAPQSAKTSAPRRRKGFDEVGDSERDQDGRECGRDGALGRS